MRRSTVGLRRGSLSDAFQIAASARLLRFGLDLNSIPVQHLIVFRWQLVVNIPYQADTHLCRVVSSQNVADKMCLDLHLYHFQSPSQHTTQYVGIPKLVLSTAVVGELYEVGEGVLIEDERELFAVACPIRNGRCYVEKDLEAHLSIPQC